MITLLTLLITVHRDSRCVGGSAGTGHGIILHPKGKFHTPFIHGRPLRLLFYSLYFLGNAHTPWAGWVGKR
jgi:hypothetical protein